jgi:hypothetical protein
VPQSSAVSPRDPRLRPYRVALWIVYFTVLLLGVGLMSVSIARTLRGPARSAKAAGPLPTRAALRGCLLDLENLNREQNERAWTLAHDLEARDPVGRWNLWARDWERRVDDLSDRCRLDAGSGDDAAARGELAAARDALLALHRAYKTQVNRFGQEHGDLAQAAAEAMANARVAVGQAR